MPRGDRTGPAGFGPRTGRAAGFCAGYDIPGYLNAGPRGGGFGHGWGWRHWSRPGWEHGYGWGRWGGSGYYPPESRVEALQAFAKSLEQELEQIRREIQSLEQSREQTGESD